MVEHEPFTSFDSKGDAHEFVLSAERGPALVNSDAIARLDIEVATTPEQLGDGYNAALEEIRPGVWRPMLVNNRSISAYSGKGITAAVYRWVARTTGGVVQSSAGGDAGGWDERNELAERVWRRLEEAGEAVYDPAEDRFYHPRKPG